MKPMLAARVESLAQVKYPVYASPKLDGVRGVVVDGQLYSRSLKRFPNAHVNALFSRPEYNGLDGELILGTPTAKDAYRVTNAACARHDGTPDVKFYVFDVHNTPLLTFEDRSFALRHKKVEPPMYVLAHALLTDEAALLAYETKCLNAGYEGLILRSPEGKYKFGRSTVREQGMMKLKRFSDSEATILAVVEELENTNEQTRSELGYAKRSTHQAGKVPKGRAGALHVRDLHTGREFHIGTGMDDTDRTFFWLYRERVVGQVVKYKFFAVGVKDLPRFPVYLGPRAEWDLS